MDNLPLGLMEMCIVLAFALGWGILELVSLRLDKKRAAERRSTDGENKKSDPS